MQRQIDECKASLGKKNKVEECKKAVAGELVKGFASLTTTLTLPPRISLAGKGTERASIGPDSFLDGLLPKGPTSPEFQGMDVHSNGGSPLSTGGGNEGDSSFPEAS